MTNIAESLKKAISAIVNTKLSGVRISLPAEIVSYDALKNTVSAKILVYKELVNSGGTKLGAPIIENIPVIFSGNSTVGIFFEPKPKDSALLFFSDIDISAFTNRGLEGAPESVRKFNINDCFAMITETKATAGALSTGEVLKIKAGESEILAKSDGSVTINGHLKVLL